MNKELAVDFEYRRKQGMQLHSKMRFIATQFERYLTNDLWKKNALQANAMAQLLKRGIETIPQLEVSQEVAANGVFVFMPAELIPKIQKHYFFHVWNESPEGKPGIKEVRLMCSWDTTKEDVEGFITSIKEIL